MVKTVAINRRLIGQGRPCYVILEAGVNFKDIREARKLIDSALEVGADCIKFQTFHADTTVVKGAKLKDGRGTVDQYNELLESEDKQTAGFQKELFNYARKKGITAFSTPSHFKDVDLLEKVARPPAYKVGSDDLTNIPLLRYIARLKKPMIISTGVSTMAEIVSAVKAIREEGNQDIILLHCVSQYPSKPGQMNLAVIRLLRERFKLPVGLSDHTMTTSIPLAAVALGASVIEKHYTLNRKVPGPDNFFSMLPCEMKQIIRSIREVESAIGSPRKRLIAVEREMRRVFRKSIHATRNIQKGEVLSVRNIDILRPMGGIAPGFIDKIYGLKAIKTILAGEPITPECLK